MAFPFRFLARREFSLPSFDLPPLEFEATAADEDELLLDRVVAVLDSEPNIVSLAGPLPTAGELRESIDRHLNATRGRAPTERVPDPAEELRSALAELRLSLG